MKKYNFRCYDQELSDQFEQMLISYKVNGRRKFKSQAAFFIDAMKRLVNKQS